MEIVLQGLCAFLLGICVQFNDDSVSSFTREDLCQLIVKRAGLETFLDKLGAVSKYPGYNKAAQKPQLRYRKPDDLIFDFEFCKLVKSIEHVVIKAVQSKPNDPANGPESNMTADQHRLLMQYKELIRTQDQELQTLRKDVQALHEYGLYAQQQMHELSSSCQQLRDQNSLLKIQKGTVNGIPNGTSAAALSSVEEGYSPQLIDDLRYNNSELQRQLQEVNEQLARWVSCFNVKRCAQLEKLLKLCF